MSEAQIDELQLTQGLLESSWDEIEDLPEFAMFPVSSAQFNVESMKAEPNHDRTKMAIKVLLKFEEVFDVAENQQYEIPVPAEGSLMSATYSGKFGIEKFKKDWLEVAQTLGANGPAELIEMVQGATVAVQIGIRPDKEKKNPETGQPVLYNEIKAVAAI